MNICFQSVKCTIIELLFARPNPIPLENGLRWQNGELIRGKLLNRKLEKWTGEDRKLLFAVFNDWLPMDAALSVSTHQ